MSRYRRARLGGVEPSCRGSFDGLKSKSRLLWRSSAPIRLSARGSRRLQMDWEREEGEHRVARESAAVSKQGQRCSPAGISRRNFKLCRALERQGRKAGLRKAGADSMRLAASFPAAWAPGPLQQSRRRPRKGINSNVSCRTKIAAPRAPGSSGSEQRACTLALDAPSSKCLTGLHCGTL
jgi:hypothetical protein